jgi:hypothetical protein
MSAECIQSGKTISGETPGSEKISLTGIPCSRHSCKKASPAKRWNLHGAAAVSRQRRCGRRHLQSQQKPVPLFQAGKWKSFWSHFQSPRNSARKACTPSLPSSGLAPARGILFLSDFSRKGEASCLCLGSHAGCQATHAPTKNLHNRLKSFRDGVLQLYACKRNAHRSMLSGGWHVHIKNIE